MTYKNIDFYDSPVMRELARNAIKNKTVTPTPVAEVIKTASAKNVAVAVSGNLMLDLAVLADNLFAKGFQKEAESLTEKLLAYKKAAVEFSSVLDAAHPDGDTKMSPAKDGHGDVETLESAHLKLIEIVNKVPNGKQAAVQDLLAKTAAILKKSEDVTLADEFDGTNDRRDSSLLKITEALTTYFPAIHGQLTAGLEELSIELPFTVANILSLPNVAEAYAAEVPTDVKKINDFVLLNSLVGNPSSLLTDPTKLVRNVIFYQPLNKAIKWSARINPTIAATLNSLPEDFDRSESLSSNMESNFDNKSANSVGESAVRDIVALWNTGAELFSADKLEKAKNGFTAKRDVIFANYQKSVQFFSNNAFDDNVKLSPELIKSVSAHGKSLAAYTADGSLGQQYNALISKIWPQWKSVIFVTVPQAIDQINVLVNKLNSNVINPNYALVTDVSAILANVKGAAKLFFDKSQSVGKDDRSYAAHFGNYENCNQLFNVIRGAKDKSYAELFASLQDFPPFFADADTQDKLIAGSLALLNAAANETGSKASPSTGKTSAAQNTMAKKGAPFVLKSAPAKTPGGTAPVKPGSAPINPAAGRKPDGTFAGTLDESEKEAVKKMQAALIELGDKKGKPEWKAVGKGGDPNPDGAWGSGTAKILESVKKHMADSKVGGTLETGDGPGFGWGGGGAETVRKANANTAVLNSYLGNAGGSVVQNGAELDKLPTDAITAQGMNPTVSQIIAEKGKSLYEGNLNSLLNFYNYLTANGMQPTVVDQGQLTDLQPTQGFTVVQWQSTLTWFLTRAKFVFSVAKAEQKQNAAKYHSMVNGLVKTLNGIIITNKIDKDVNGYNLVITEQQLAAAYRPGNGSGVTQQQSGSEYSAWTNAPNGQNGQAGPRGDFEGEDRERRRRQTSPPIDLKTGNIDLNSGWYPDLPKTQGSGLLVLGMEGTNAGQMARLLFGRISGNNPRQYLNFMNQLSNNIGNAISTWVQRAKPLQEDREIMTELQNDWEKVFDKQIRQLEADGLIPRGNLQKGQK